MWWRLVADTADPRLMNEPPILVQAGWSDDRGSGQAFSAPVLRTIAIAIPWIHAVAPVGDPLLRGLPSVLATARGRLASPTLILPLGWVQWPGHQEALRAMGARARQVAEQAFDVTLQITRTLDVYAEARARAAHRSG